MLRSDHGRQAHFGLGCMRFLIVVLVMALTVGRPCAGPFDEEIMRSCLLLALAAWPLFCDWADIPLSSIMVGRIVAMKSPLRRIRCSTWLRCAKFSRLRCWLDRFAMATWDWKNVSRNTSVSCRGAAIFAE